MPACPRCNTANPDGAATCSACGFVLKGMAGAKASAPRPKVVVRVVRADGGPELTVTMKGNVLTCGRQGDVVLLDDPFVAQAQAQLAFSGGRLSVDDVGGQNGVFVRLRGERELSPGGELRLGRQRLVLEVIPPLPVNSELPMAWGSPDPGYRFRLVQLLEGGGRAAAYPLAPGAHEVGREQGEIAFPGDGFVSGRHAVLKVTADVVTVQDVGSSNGTFVRLAGPTPVESGDQFLIGRQLLRVDF